MTTQATYAKFDNTNSINCGGMGAHEQWERNSKKAKRDGLESCAHCAKGMVEGTGWLVRWVWQIDAIVDFNSTEGEVRRIGNSCVKNFLTPEFKNTHFVKVGA